MNAYGQPLTWSTVNAPHLVGGICEDYTYADRYEKNPIEGEVDLAALVLHRRKGEIGFNTTVTNATDNFLDLSIGVKITVSAIEGGVILVRQAREHWEIGQPKTASFAANHYPFMADSSGAMAAFANAMTPAQTEQEGIIIRPLGKVVYSTAGLTHVSGIVQSLDISQSVQLQEEEDALGRFIAAFASHYQREIELTLAATGAKPQPGTTLSIGGAPTNGVGYVITDAEEVFRKKEKKLYRISAMWAPVFDEPDLA